MNLCVLLILENDRASLYLDLCLYKNNDKLNFLFSTQILLFEDQFASIDLLPSHLDLIFLGYIHDSCAQFFRKLARMQAVRQINDNNISNAFVVGFISLSDSKVFLFTFN